MKKGSLIELFGGHSATFPQLPIFYLELLPDVGADAACKSNLKAKIVPANREMPSARQKY